MSKIHNLMSLYENLKSFHNQIAAFSFFSWSIKNLNQLNRLINLYNCIYLEEHTWYL